MESLGSLKSQWLTLDKIIKPKGLYEKFRVYAELKLRGRGKVVNLLENQWRGTLAYLVKCGEIKTTSDLYEFADNTDHYILNQASPRNLEVLKGIGPLTEIFKRISYFPDGQFLYSWFKPEVLSYLLEMEDVKNVEGLLVFFEKHKDKLEVFSRVDVEVIKRFCTFFNIKSLDQVGDVDLDTYIKTMHSLDRSGVDIEQIDPLVIYMGAIEDVQGDVLRVNSEIEKAKQVLGISRDSRNFQQDFKSILDYYYTESGLKKRLERLRLE